MKKNTHIRANGKVYRDVSSFTELFILRAIQEISISRIISRDSKLSFIEYGCGTGHNLEFLKTKFKYLQYFGADWTESACERLFNRKVLGKQNIFQVDFFKPTTFKSPPTEYVVFTNHSLEQAGAKYKEFIEFLISDENCLGGVHIEPMREL